MLHNHEPPLEPTLVFLPGLGADHRLFKYQMAAFPNSYAVDWIDPLKNESLEQYAVRLAGVIRLELGKQPPVPIVVCGLSFGGMVAPYVAHELDASACILLCTIREPRQFPKRYYANWLLMRLCPLFQLAGLFFIRSFARFFLCFPRLLQRFVEPEVFQAFVEMPLHRLAGLFRMMFNWAYRHRPKEGGMNIFDKPTLHIHGTNDWLLPIRLTNPDVCVEGGGHLLVLTHSEKVNEIIQRFVAEYRLKG